jgi:glycosyltransferase involved in cell wall biosynthesis
VRRIRARANCGCSPPRHRLNPADVTFVVLTKDEERRIEGCLRSLPRTAPGLVYDAESSDGTTSIARALGAEVVSRPWSGFARARSGAAAMVRTPWTFMLDADERLTKELRDEIVALEAPDDVDAYSVARKNYFCGRWIRGAGWWPDRLVRLFRSGKASVEARDTDSTHAVHERWRVSGRCLQLGAPLEHDTYPTIADYRRKFAHYTALEAVGLRGRVGWSSLLAAWSLMPVRALWLLIGRRGLLDGWRGLYVCVGSACYPAVARWKARGT